MVRLRSTLSLLAITASSTARLLSTGFSVSFNEVYYYISPFSAGSVPVCASKLKALDSIHGFVPITVVSEEVSQAELPGLFSNWTAKDDVFQPAFLQAVFLAGQTTSLNATLSSGVRSQIIRLSSKPEVPSGPYFIEKSTGELYPVYRLYNDFAGAFTEALLSTPDGTFQPLSAKIASSATLSIGVPSRIYYTPTAEKPLAGIRIGVKDLYQVAGIKSSYGNRAYYNLYPANEVTAPAIARLIDAGAVIVGTQKLSQFANGEQATQDWVDYHSPFNPRGDGYQDPSSSSSGAGASIASYEWLDVAVGSDTGGSIRGPSLVQGLFGNRPSHGLVTLEHAMPLSPTLDTAGFLLRDPALWDALNSVMYAGSYDSLARTAPKYPTKILTLGTLPSATTEAGKVVRDFVTGLAAFVGGTVSTIDLQATWAATGPTGTANATLQELLGTAYATLISREQVALVREPFYADYAAAHDGRLPFVNPVPLARWAWGDKLAAGALDEAVYNKTVFMDWFNSAVLPAADDAATCSSGLMLYVGSTGGQNPRNQYGSSPSAPIGFSSSRISVFAEVPDSVFPLGQAGSFSAITNHTEYLPIAVDIMAAKGCDGLLARLATDLVAAGILKVPQVGGTIYGGDILMKRHADGAGIVKRRYVE